MANRRMIARDVICNNSFITLPYSAQALFFQLTIDADDGGFVGSTERVLRTIGCTQDDMSALIEKGFVIRFDNDVIVMRHWKIANTVKNDRQTTNFQNELAQLRIDTNKIYNLIPNNSRMETFGNEVIPKRTEGSPKEPNQKEKKGTQFNIREKSAREGEHESGEKFNRFWAAYPRKQKRSDAEKAFLNINPSDNLLETMLDALTVQKKSKQWINENGKYIPYPTTWLNGKRWEDEPPPSGNSITPKNPTAGTVGPDGRIANGYGQWEGLPTKIYKDGRWIERDTA